MSRNPDTRSVGPDEICKFKVCDAVRMTMHQFAEFLICSIDVKDHCTNRHSEKVALVARGIGLKLGLSAKQADLLHVGGHLHDIGKVGVGDAILKKPGPLTRSPGGRGGADPLHALVGWFGRTSRAWPSL
ncbi:HD domain-containing protein [Desulfovibrio sp. Huiquan2017]|uniref:HD-GYP domain-containing protein n=1 Tax=Desulfovibrio sp. Huiquan2017 TaxID=2816861 RepID=UPI001A910CC1|nr:HD domain-containing protein [Desulfovibrio sp. Huiquan2017]